MRRLGLLALPLAGALVLGGAPAVAEPIVPGPGVPLARSGTLVDAGFNSFYESGPSVVAVDTAGTRIVASQDGRIQERRAGGSWSAPRALPGAGTIADLQVASGRPGTALAAYVRTSGYGKPRALLAQVRGPSRTWSAPYALTKPASGARFDVQVLSNEDGDHAVVWARSDLSRPQLHTSIRLRGDRWRTTSLGPLVGGFTAAMDASGAVYVAREYGPGNDPTSVVRRVKRPGRAPGAAVVLPTRGSRYWTYLVERTGRQTLVVNDHERPARVLRQETLGGPLVTVWSEPYAWVRAAVGGGRLRLVRQRWTESGTSAAWTQVVRPRPGPAVALGEVYVARPFMDAHGRGVILSGRDDRVEPGQPLDDIDTVWARSFTDSGMRAPFRVAGEPAGYPEEGLGIWWDGWNATDGHQLLVTYSPHANQPEQEGGGMPYETQLWSTQVKR
ncbi:hypothetical protein [Nocardioides sp. LML1-1-1.1]|uniref:hypothetical protein n=1 Tax=Nocardioides sp. LML1-1-1.1 TaxID=3135248 RepID=UPI00341AFD18